MGGTMTRLARYLVPLLMAVALVAAPSLLGDFQVTLLTQGVAWGILGLSVWLLLRICDLPSFGHAAFFGVGAYTAGLAVTRWHFDNVFLALGAAVGLSCLVALPIALVASRLKNVSFLLITLAFANMLASLAGRWRVLGGSDGLVGVIRPHTSPLHLDIVEPTGFYFFALIVLGLSLAVLLVLVRSPVGGALLGIRESEHRMAALGYNPMPYRVFAFLVSAGLAGGAGLVNAYLSRFVDPSDLGALVSARALLIVVIGGSSIFGPPIAAIALTELEDLLSSHTERWLGIIGVVYVLVALLAPDRAGLAALWRRARGLGGVPPVVAPQPLGIEEPS
jgi:branched-chain amino acid transport system permease protein